MSLAEARYRDYLALVNDTPPRRIDDLPTPSLLLDLDILASNLRSMQRRADDLGVRLRPHVKTHKCLEIANLQRDMGARGITVSTLEEARAFARHGFTDITWAFPLNPSRVSEAIELATEIDFAVTVDSATAIDSLEARAVRPVGVWIEVDCGYGRSGIDPESGEALDLARRIQGSTALELRGALTHAGQTYGASPADIPALAEHERSVMVAFGDRLESAGLGRVTLSVGSTPGMTRVARLDGIDEARPGNYALFDYTQVRLGSCGIDDCAATVLATVVSSHPDRGRSVADCGALVLSKDPGPDREPTHYGRLFSDLDRGALDPEARIVSVSQEHAVLSRSFPVGTKIRVLPHHSCLTVAHFDAFTTVRGRRVLGTWKIWRARQDRLPDGTVPSAP